MFGLPSTQTVPFPPHGPGFFTNGSTTVVIGNLSAARQGDAVFDYTNQVKLDGTYRVPAFGGFNVSAVYRYTTGLAWGRVATIRGLAQGNETVRIEPKGTRRTDPINNLDLRVEKTFPLGASARQAGVYLDIFNVNNQGVIDNGVRTGVIDSSGSTFGNPNNWISARIARLGFRVTF